MEMTIPASRHRVQLHTAQHVNEEIRENTEASLAHYANHPELIDARLAQLDREWDIERTLEANAATLALTGVCLGATISRKWLILPAVVTGFLLQHAVQGCCPPLPLLRRMGFRTPNEIEDERNGLIAIRDRQQRTVRGENL